MGNWVRREPAVFTAGDVSEVQTSDAWDARWVLDLPGDMFGVVTRAFYLTANGAECQTEYLVCTDPKDPGSTEEWSDYRFERVDGTDPRRLADQACGPTDAEWGAVASSYLWAA